VKPKSCSGSPGFDFSRYYPLKSGCRWEYKGKALGVPFKMTVVNMSQVKLAGKTVTPQRKEITFNFIIVESEAQSTTSFVAIDETGIYIVATQEAADIEPRIYSSPWYNGVIERGQVVVVPAGSFENCIKLKEENKKEIAYSWLAPDVGLVKYIEKKKGNKRTPQIIFELVKYK
jgi:hypothetical protein